MPRSVRFLAFASVVYGLAAGAAPLRAAALEPAGPLLPIATAANETATYPALAGGGPDGGFLAAWRSTSTVTGEPGIFVRRLDTAGMPAAPAVRIADGEPLTGPRLAAGPDGTFVAVWDDRSQEGPVARRLDAAGQPLGGPFLVSTGGCCAGDAEVAFLATGDFVVAWREITFVLLPPIVERDRIMARLYNAAGTPKGAPFAVTGQEDFLDHPRLAADPAGGFAVAWEDVVLRVSSAVKVRRYGADGTAAGPETTVTRQGTGPLPLFAPGGALSVVWANASTGPQTHPAGLFARQIAGDGTLAGGEIQLLAGPLYDERPALAADRAGDALLVWMVPGPAADAPSSLHARLFAPDWQPLGPEVPVHGFQQRQRPYPSLTPPAEPAAAAGGEGFLAVWEGALDHFPQSGQISGQRLSGDCLAGSGALCLAGGRFRVEVSWYDPHSGADGPAFPGTALPLTGDTGSFWFFTPGNAELLVKVLDGRGVNGHWWVFFGALSDVEYDLTVTDSATGARKTYHNAPGTMASRADVTAFADTPAFADSAAEAPLEETLEEDTGPALHDTAAGSGAALGPFTVTVDWVDPSTHQTRHATGVPLGSDSAYFWFFDPANIELIVKVLDGRPVNGHWWVFYGALSDVEYTIRVEGEGQTRIYHNPRGQMASRADTGAF